MLTILFQEGGTPLYLQIYEFLKLEIRQGRLVGGQKLPSRRKWASHLCVSVNTVDNAYGQLVAEGYVEALPKRGYFVCHMEPLSPLEAPPLPPAAMLPKRQPPPILDFSPTDVDSAHFPFDTFRRLFKNTFHECATDLLQRGEPQGDLPLRQVLAEMLARSRGVHCTPMQIVIGSGTDNLLQGLALFFGRHKTMVCENPSYQKAYRIFSAMGNPVQAVDMDEKGILTGPLEHLENMAVYVTPSNHFPLGFSMPIDRRIQLLRLFERKMDSYIIEDDYDSEFRYNEKPLPSLQSIDRSGKVIYMGTFSKSIAPSFRVGYMVLPPALAEAYLHGNSFLGSPVPLLEQRLISAFLESGQYDTHIHKMRKLYRDKREVLLRALQTLAPKVATLGEHAGHHLVLHVKNGMAEATLCRSALGAGVRVYPLSPYFSEKPPTGSRILLGYGALTAAELQEGVAKLKGAWQL